MTPLHDGASIAQWSPCRYARFLQDRDAVFEVHPQDRILQRHSGDSLRVNAMAISCPVRSAQAVKKEAERTETRHEG
jgi:hypothetical protein